MSMKFGLITACLIVFLVFNGAGSFCNASEGNGDCLGCHPNLGKKAQFEHGAVRIGCKSCHIDPEKKHPSQKGSMKLVREIPNLCYACHKKQRIHGTYTHTPVQRGNCISCHEPHKSGFDHLLLSDTPLLCYNCHDKARFTKKNIHPVIIGRTCDCHKPHSSDYPFLLSSTTNEVCIGCHRAKQSGNHVVSLPHGKVHPLGGVPMPRNPRKMITCAACHNPHSSDFQKLFPKKRVCPICHKYY